MCENRENQQLQHINGAQAEMGALLPSAPPALPTGTNHGPQERAPTQVPGSGVHPSTSDDPPSYNEISPDPPPDYSSVAFSK